GIAGARNTKHRWHEAPIAPGTLAPWHLGTRHPAPLAPSTRHPARHQAPWHQARGTRMIRLSVNVNKVATLRNARGGRTPSVTEAVGACVAAGAPGITVHPRADRRHITPDDVREIARVLRTLPPAV